jgi:hypothetical protein
VVSRSQVFPCCRTSCCPCITEEKCAGSSRCCCDIAASGCCGPGPCCEWRCCGFGFGACYSSDSPDGLFTASTHPDRERKLLFSTTGDARRRAGPAVVNGAPVLFLDRGNDIPGGSGQGGGGGGGGSTANRSGKQADRGRHVVGGGHGGFGDLESGESGETTVDDDGGRGAFGGDTKGTRGHSAHTSQRGQRSTETFFAATETGQSSALPMTSPAGGSGGTPPRAGHGTAYSGVHVVGEHRDTMGTTHSGGPADETHRNSRRSKRRDEQARFSEANPHSQSTTVAAGGRAETFFAAGSGGADSDRPGNAKHVSPTDTSVPAPEVADYSGVYVAGAVNDGYSKSTAGVQGGWAEGFGGMVDGVGPEFSGFDSPSPTPVITKQFFSEKSPGAPKTPQSNAGPAQVFFTADNLANAAGAAPATVPSTVPTETALTSAPTAPSLHTDSPIAGSAYLEDGSVIPFTRPGGESALQGVPNPAYQE